MNKIEDHPLYESLMNEECLVVRYDGRDFDFKGNLSQNNIDWVGGELNQYDVDSIIQSSESRFFLCDRYPDELIEKGRGDDAIVSILLKRGLFLKRCESVQDSADNNACVSVLVDWSGFDYSVTVRTSILETIKLAAESCGFRHEFLVLDESYRYRDIPEGTSLFLISNDVSRLVEIAFLSAQFKTNFRLLSNIDVSPIRTQCLRIDVISLRRDYSNLPPKLSGLCRKLGSWFLEPNKAIANSFQAESLQYLPFYIGALNTNEDIESRCHAKYHLPRLWLLIDENENIDLEKLFSYFENEYCGPSRYFPSLFYQVLKRFSVETISGLIIWKKIRNCKLFTRDLITVHLAAVRYEDVEVIEKIHLLLEFLFESDHQLAKSCAKFITSSDSCSESSFVEFDEVYGELYARCGIGFETNLESEKWDKLLRGVHHIKFGTFEMEGSFDSPDYTEWICAQSLWPWGYLLPMIRFNKYSQAICNSICEVLFPKIDICSNSRKIYYSLISSIPDDLCPNNRRIMDMPDLGASDIIELVFHLTLADRRNEAEQIWKSFKVSECDASDPLIWGECGPIDLWYMNEISFESRWIRMTNECKNEIKRNYAFPDRNALINLWYLAVSLGLNKTARYTENALRLIDLSFIALESLKNRIPRVELDADVVELMHEVLIPN